MANTCANSSGGFKARINLSGSGTEHPSSCFYSASKARLLSATNKHQPTQRPTIGVQTPIYSHGSRPKTEITNHLSLRSFTFKIH